MSLRAAPDKGNAGSQQIQHALPPWPIQAHDRFGFALGGSPLYVKQQRRADLPSRIDHQAVSTFSARPVVAAACGESGLGRRLTTRGS